VPVFIETLLETRREDKAENVPLECLRAVRDC